MLRRIKTKLKNVLDELSSRMEMTEKQSVNLKIRR